MAGPGGLYNVYVNDELFAEQIFAEGAVYVTETGFTYNVGDLIWTYTGGYAFLGLSATKNAIQPDAGMNIGQNFTLAGASADGSNIYLYSVESRPTYTPAQMAEAILNIPMSGVDTSDATAAASDIVSGKTAYVNEEKITGTLTSKSSSNLTVSGATVTVPAGYYSASASKSVATATHAKPTASISSSGLITASHTQAAGYVSAGTTTGTLQLTTQAAKTVTPSTSSQTAVASGRYTTGAVKLAAMPTATQATPTISVNTTTGVVTATSTQSSAGYISAGTKTATQQIDVWDGSLTVETSGGAVTLIEFSIYASIGGTIAYQAEEDMTWYEWCNSEYNTGSLTCSSNGLVNDNNGSWLLWYNTAYVVGSDTIIANATYALRNSGSAD